jgi:DNA mismatch endonuclease (patch repair protein)
MDHLSSEQRSQLMSRIRGRDTKPELVVRRVAHALGYRYRLHRASLPGCPDLVFGPRRKAVFVHGCFWHQHDCKRGTQPKGNGDFWRAKLARNRERDIEAIRSLELLGWSVLVVWECQTRDKGRLAERLATFLA